MPDPSTCFAPMQGVWSGNAGLWYTKFFDRWDADLAGITPSKAENPKLDWIDSLVYPRDHTGRPNRSKPPVKTGCPHLLAETAQRRATLAEKQEGICLEFTLDSRLLTGTGLSHPIENGTAWHPTLGVPYLAGSSVKGLLRAWAVQVGAGDVARLFGPSTEGSLQVGAISALDALPIEPVQLAAEIITPHTGPWNQVEPVSGQGVNLDDAPADWHSPVPIPLLATEAGAIFQFVLLPCRGAPLDQRCSDWLKDALRELGAGAKTANGYGRFRPKGSEPGAIPDVTLPKRARTAPNAPGQISKPKTANPRHGTVDGEAVEILREVKGEYQVRYVGGTDTDWVSIDKVTIH
jgi:CRISPR-associated protein Cmr6